MSRHARSAGPHKKGAAVSMPWPWDTARYCLELPAGTVKHFPAGTYDRQVATETGRLELELMSIAHSAWYVFKRQSAADWNESDRRFARWVMPDPPQPSARWQGIVNALWPFSGWFWLALRPHRGGLT